MYGQYLRAVYNQEQVMMVRVWYTKLNSHLNPVFQVKNIFLHIIYIGSSHNANQISGKSNQGMVWKKPLQYSSSWNFFLTSASEKKVLRERSLMTSHIRVGRGVQDSHKKGTLQNRTRQVLFITALLFQQLIRVVKKPNKG